MKKENNLTKLKQRKKPFAKQLEKQIVGFPEKLSIPGWHKIELDRRYQEWKEGKLELHDWEKIHSDIRKKYQ